jgi:hypothetical protein
MTPADALRAVRARLLSHGWTPSGSRCLLQTFDRVVPDAAWPIAGRPAWEALRASIGVPSLVEWNHADQELPIVVAAIDRALEELR